VSAIVTTTSDYRICSRCIMDSSDPDIAFDENGVCNHCHHHDLRISRLPSGAPDWQAKLQAVAEQIKASRRGEYDSVMGLSGGVDSSYVAYTAHKLGLRPLAVHFDNGWNSELAVRNIENIVKKLGFDLQTYVIDWTEFRDLQRAFIRANVVDIEMLTDHAIFAALYKLAVGSRIRYVLSGTNFATESVMPPSWLHMKADFRNIRAIHRRFGAVRLRSFPRMSVWRLAYYQYIRGIRSVSLLNYIPYRKSDAMRDMEREIGWQYYGGKHYESTFTKFYQAHILPEKFHIDKRRCHWSNLVLNGEITREQALAELAKPLYAPDELATDKAYVLKKLGMSVEDFDQYLRTPGVPHAAYPSDAALARQIMELTKRFRPV
jgi:N-acetyl sugar amidotransferase